jgi:hypothetical protein
MNFHEYKCNSTSDSMFIRRGEIVSADFIKTPTLYGIAFVCGDQGLYQLLHRSDWYAHGITVGHFKSGVAFSVEPNTIVVTINRGYADDVVLAVSREISGPLSDFIKDDPHDVIHWIARRAELEHSVKLKEDHIVRQTRGTDSDIRHFRHTLDTDFRKSMREMSAATRPTSPS